MTHNYWRAWIKIPVLYHGATSSLFTVQGTYFTSLSTPHRSLGFCSLHSSDNIANPFPHQRLLYIAEGTHTTSYKLVFLRMFVMRDNSPRRLYRQRRALTVACPSMTILRKMMNDKIMSGEGGGGHRNTKWEVSLRRSNTATLYDDWKSRAQQCIIKNKKC